MKWAMAQPIDGSTSKMVIHSYCNSTESHFRVFLWQQHQRDATDMIISGNSVFARGKYFSLSRVNKTNRADILGSRKLYRFSAFWLRSKCSICSYQLNIWYGSHVLPSILNWFLPGDEVQELAPASSRVDPVLQYRWDRPTSPIMPMTVCRRSCKFYNRRQIALRNARWKHCD